MLPLGINDSKNLNNKKSMELNTSECCLVNSEDASQIKDPRILASSYTMFKIGKSNSAAKIDVLLTATWHYKREIPYPYFCLLHVLLGNGSVTDFQVSGEHHHVFHW